MSISDHRLATLVAELIILVVRAAVQPDAGGAIYKHHRNRTVKTYCYQYIPCGWDGVIGDGVIAVESRHMEMDIQIDGTTGSLNDGHSTGLGIFEASSQRPFSIVFFHFAPENIEHRAGKLLTQAE